jgi:hypothetical protein
VDWRSGGHNALILSLALLACLEKQRRRRPPLPPSPARSVSESTGASLRGAVGFGALLFALHHLLADSGSLIARTWTGWPLTGPAPLPHGAFTVLAMAVGLALPFSAPLYLLALGGAAMLYLCDDWLGFGGGLALAVWLMSALPPFLRSVATHEKPALAFLVAYLVYDLFVLADVRHCSATVPS